MSAPAQAFSLICIFSFVEVAERYSLLNCGMRVSSSLFVRTFLGANCSDIFGGAKLVVVASGGGGNGIGAGGTDVGDGGGFTLPALGVFDGDDIFW